MTESTQRLSTALTDRYTIERELGAGGMATVYLAHDMKHDRKVAIKVLRPELAAVLGAERFVQEIKTTAHLQHPNILPLFDSGEADSFLYYVMPYIEGETLRDKLNREKQLGIEEAVQVTTEVAAALDYAHRQEVIHRDIKPENILLHDGRPMVADFGIALAVSAAAGGRMTETGLSLGTPHYMSPEQATAEKELTNRSDIYSLGAVLYEVLTGDPPHTGSTAQQVIAKIVADEPRPITELRKTAPPNVAAAVGKALEKLPADRFTSAAKFAEALSRPGAFEAPELTSTAEPSTRRPLLLTAAVIGWSVAALLLLLVLTRSAPRDETFSRLSIPLPPSMPLSFAGPSPLGIWQKALDITRDGQTIVYVARVDGTTQLAVRRMEDPTVTLLEGTEGAYHPFFSPDGEWIGFFVGQELQKIRASGGRPVTLATGLFVPVGASWGEDGRILVADREGRAPAWIPEAGGAPERIGTQPSQLEAPHLLPDGQWAVGTVHYTGQLALYSTEENAVLAVTRRGLVRDSMPVSDWLIGYSPVYSPSGHILYLSPGDGVLMALPFDAERRRVLGDPQPVLNNVRKEETYGFGHVAMSRNGTLVYAPGGNADIGYLALVDRTGRIDTLPFERASYAGIRMSPDGERIAATIRNEVGVRAAYMLHLRRGRSEQIPVAHPNPASWSAGGDSLILQDFAQGNWWITEDIGRAKLVYSLFDGSTHSLDLGDASWLDHSSPSGRIAWATYLPEGKVLVRMSVDDSTIIEIARGAAQTDLSPDGRWIGYTRGADLAVVVSPVPPTGLHYQVSRGFGEQAQWFPTGDRLVYRDGRDIWEVAVSTAAGFDAEEPRLFARGPFVRVWYWSYDVAPDGRLLVVLGTPEESVGRIEVVTNAFALLGN